MATVLITGCSTGFGLLTTVELATRGHRVFASMRDTDRAGALREALAAAGATAEVVRLDVTDPASIASAVDDVIAAAGAIDVVVNNAGVAAVSPVEELAVDELARIFETNVFGPLRVVHAVLPRMREAGRGHVVNVTSVAAFVAPPFMGAYAASKHAIDALGEALAAEVAPFGIAVTNVAPGPYLTAMVAAVGDERAAIDPDSPYAARRHTMLDHHEAAMRQNDDPEAVAVAVADAIEADPPPARVVVPEASTFIVQARGATPPEQLRSMLSQSYGV